MPNESLTEMFFRLAAEERDKRSKAVPKFREPLKLQPTFLPNYKGRSMYENQMFAERQDFGLYSLTQKIRRQGPRLLLDLVDDFYGGLGPKHLPVPIVTAMWETAMQSYLSESYKWSEIENNWEKYNLLGRVNRRFFEPHWSVMFRHEPAQWTPVQLYVEQRSFRDDQERSKVIPHHYPQFTKVVHILSSLHVDLANPGVVMWYECDPTMEFYSESKVFTSRWGKFLKMLRRKYGFRFTDQEIDEVAYWVGDNLKMPHYDFVTVRKKAIRETYEEAHFGSCMHTSSAVKFYGLQDNVQLLRIQDNANELVGRALIWQGKDPDGKDVTILDRIYPSDGGPHIRAAQKYAADQGWVYKLEQTIGGPLSQTGRFRVHVKDVSYYPYMDTFALAEAHPDSDGYFWLHNDEDGHYAGEPWHNTGGYSPFTGEEDEDMCYCERCGNDMHADDALRTPDGELWCESCFHDHYVWSDTEDEHIRVDDAVEVANTTYHALAPTDSPYLVYSEPDDCYYLTERRGSTRIDDQVVLLTGGRWADEYTVGSNTRNVFDLIVHVDDPKFDLCRIAEEERQSLF